MVDIEVKEADIELTGETLYMVAGQVEIVLGRFKKNPDKVIVVKKIYPIDEDYNKMKREVISLYKLNHPAIPKFYGCYWSYRNGINLLCVLIEYFQNGDLGKEIIRRRNNFWPEAELLHHFSILVDAFAYMECAGFAHRDIKPQNIFIGNDGNFKVGDFGCSIQSFEHQLREMATISGSPIYLSPLIRDAWIAYQQGLNPGGRIDHNVYKSDVYSLGLTFLYMTTLKEPIELVSLQYLKEKIAGKLSQIRYRRIIPLLDLMLQVNENERPNFIQLKQFYNENINFISVNLIAQARLIAEMANEKLFSARKFNLLYFKGANLIRFNIKNKNINLLANLYTKCNNESLNTVEKEILLDLIKNGETLDILCKICCNRIWIEENSIRSKCNCKYWIHEACIDEKLRVTQSLICNICNSSFLSQKNQIFCQSYKCPGSIKIPKTGKTFRCKTCLTEFCKACKINIAEHKQKSCINLSLDKRSLRCEKCGEVAIRERGSFHYNCQNCGYLCIVCSKGIYASHQKCCISFISLNQF